MKRIGLFGGSFNPVHTGHLILAEYAREETALDEILFVPARTPPHKPLQPLAPAEDRLEMLDLAIKGNSTFQSSDLELNRSGPSYTLQTVMELKKSKEEKEKLFLILGADSILDLPNWWRSKELIEEVEIIGLKRPGYSMEQLEDLHSYFAEDTVRELRESLIEAPLLQISATEIRNRIINEKSIRYLVPDPVRDYIRENELFI